jgi:tellurite resistance protein TehA-like permease
MFAFVMASGIVSVAASLQGLPSLSWALFAVACLGWATLALTLTPRLLAEASATPPRFEAFAVVAATAVLGTRLALMGEMVLALALWALAAAVWLTVLARRPRGGRADGAWFLIVVGTESLAVLASLLALHWGAALADAALACWVLGLCVYPAVATAIGAELRRRPRFGPDLWIAMGALAIATLAGTELLLGAERLHTLAAVQGWLRATDLATWGLASAWIPVLIAAELRHRAGWRTAVGRWSFVFPLGMYAVATQQLGRTASLAPLVGLGRAFFVLALLAWALVSLAVAGACFRPGK